MKRCLSVLLLSLPLAAFSMLMTSFVASGEGVSSQNSQTLSVEIYKTTRNGLGHQLGTVTISESPYGLVFTPQLTELTPGLYAFHIHTNPDCGLDNKDGKVTVAGLAGGHFDPQQTNRHSTPWDDKGHLGDLPPLYVDEKGDADLPVLAPKLKKLSDVKGHSLMIDVGHDNYSDHPQPLGGEGARFGCGVIR